MRTSRARLFWVLATVSQCGAYWEEYLNELRTTRSDEEFRRLSAPLAALVNQTYTGTNGSTCKVTPYLLPNPREIDPS